MNYFTKATKSFSFCQRTLFYWLLSIRLIVIWSGYNLYDYKGSALVQTIFISERWVPRFKEFKEWKYVSDAGFSFALLILLKNPG